MTTPETLRESAKKARQISQYALFLGIPFDLVIAYFVAKQQTDMPFMTLFLALAALMIALSAATAYVLLNQAKKLEAQAREMGE